MSGEFKCPTCSATCISFANGTIRCGACGLQEPMPGVLKLRPLYPRRWLVEDVMDVDPRKNGFEESVKVTGVKNFAPKRLY